MLKIIIKMEKKWLNAINVFTVKCNICMYRVNATTELHNYGKKRRRKMKGGLS